MIVNFHTTEDQFPIADQLMNVVTVADAHHADSFLI
jgi:hypothetical protein